jgi:hypothetical protein
MWRGLSIPAGGRPALRPSPAEEGDGPTAFSSTSVNRARAAKRDLEVLPVIAGVVELVRRRVMAPGAMRGLAQGRCVQVGEHEARPVRRKPATVEAVAGPDADLEVVRGDMRLEHQ